MIWNVKPRKVLYEIIFVFKFYIILFDYDYTGSWGSKII